MSTQGSGNFFNDENAYVDHGSTRIFDSKASSFADIESAMWGDIMSDFDAEDKQYYDMDDDLPNMFIGYCDPYYDCSYYDDF